MRKSLSCIILACLLLTSCTKEGDTIYQPTPDEEQPSTAPLVPDNYEQGLAYLITNYIYIT